MARHCFAAYLSILLLMVAAPNPAWSQPSDAARRQTHEARRDYGRAMEAFDQLDQQMKSKEYEAR